MHQTGSADLLGQLLGVVSAIRALRTAVRMRLGQRRAKRWGACRLTADRFRCLHGCDPLDGLLQFLSRGQCYAPWTLRGR
jgi:hypothetical protein